MPIVRFGFYTTSVGLLLCFPTLTIIEYKIFFFDFFFFFFYLFDILINSQADIKSYETRCLWSTVEIQVLQLFLYIISLSFFFLSLFY